MTIINVFSLPLATTPDDTGLPYKVVTTAIMYLLLSGTEYRSSVFLAEFIFVFVFT